MADRAHPVQLAGAAAEQLREPPALAVEREGVQLGEEQPRPGRIDARLALQRAEHLEVVPLLPRPGVEAGELAAAQRERRRHPLARLTEAEQVVARDLELERDPLAARGARDERRRRPDHPRPGVEPLHRLAAEPQRRLAARVEQQVDACPAHPSGTTAVPCSQYVANSGPSASPGTAARYARPSASSRAMRPTGPAISSRSTGTRSACTRRRARSVSRAMRSRAYPRCGSTETLDIRTGPRLTPRLRRGRRRAPAAGPPGPGDTRVQSGHGSGRRRLHGRAGGDHGRRRRRGRGRPRRMDHLRRQPPTGARERIGPATELVDLAGRMLMPGIHDAHLHPLSGGVVLSRPDARLCAARQGRVPRRDARADRGRRRPAAPTTGWPSTCGTRPRWTSADARRPRRAPDRAPGASSSRSTATSRSRTPGRSPSPAWRAGTEDPPGGVITRDGDGEPTGILLDAAIALVEERMPAATAAGNAAALRKAHEALVRAGVTSYMDASAFAPELAAAAALSDQGGLLVRTPGGDDDRARAGRGPGRDARPPRGAARARRAPRRACCPPRSSSSTASSSTRRRPRRCSSPISWSRTAAGSPGRAAARPISRSGCSNRAVAALDAAGWQVHVHVIGHRADPVGARRVPARPRPQRRLGAAAHPRPPRGRRPGRHPAAPARWACWPTSSSSGRSANPYTVEHLAPYLGPGALGGPLPRRRAPATPARCCAAAATCPSLPCARSRSSSAP